jgi:DNA-binding XRE family transcriptional regulator
MTGASHLDSDLSTPPTPRSGLVQPWIVAQKYPREAICSSVARHLRLAREERGLSLNALSEQAGLSCQTISFIEQEERNPTLDTLLRITAVLGITLNDLLKQAE